MLRQHEASSHLDPHDPPPYHQVLHGRNTMLPTMGFLPPWLWRNKTALFSEPQTNLGQKTSQLSPTNQTDLTNEPETFCASHISPTLQRPQHPLHLLGTRKPRPSQKPWGARRPHAGVGKQKLKKQMSFSLSLSLPCVVVVVAFVLFSLSLSLSFFLALSYEYACKKIFIYVYIMFCSINNYKMAGRDVFCENEITIAGQNARRIWLKAQKVSTRKTLPTQRIRIRMDPSTPRLLQAHASALLDGLL